jgi:CO/xanthine dehydrogenase Mo-binding subunit
MSALAAAVVEATGPRVKMLPITPEKIFALRQEQLAAAANEVSTQ